MTGTRKRTTTAISWVLIALALLGLLISLFGLTLAVFLEEPPDVRLKYLIDAALSVASKIALLTLGIGLLTRSRFIRRIACTGVLVSVADSVYNTLVILELNTVGKPPVETAATYFGAVTSAIVSLLIYVGVLVYLSVDSTRTEFTRVGGPSQMLDPSQSEQVTDQLESRGSSAKSA